MMKDAKYGTASEIMARPVAGLTAILQDSGATVYARAKACQRLAVVGDKSAVPALAPMLGHAQLAVYARMALETIPDRTADDALRAALGTEKGPLLAGVINSIGKRRDTAAIAALEKLRHSSDVTIAGAANAALSRIRPSM
jgi:HEAT repeat protein